MLELKKQVLKRKLSIKKRYYSAESMTLRNLSHIQKFFNSSHRSPVGLV